MDRAEEAELSPQPWVLGRLSSSHLHSPGSHFNNGDIQSLKKEEIMPLAVTIEPRDVILP